MSHFWTWIHLRAWAQSLWILRGAAILTRLHQPAPSALSRKWIPHRGCVENEGRDLPRKAANENTRWILLLFPPLCARAPCRKLVPDRRLPGNSVELQLPAKPTPLCSSARSSPPACLFGEHCVPRSYAVKPLGHSAGSRVRTRPLRKVVEEFLSDLAAWVFLLTHPFSAFLVQAGLH